MNKNRYTIHREKASQEQLENMQYLIKEHLDVNREEDKKYKIYYSPFLMD